MEVFLARQAIFDRHRQVYAYELLYRSDSASTSFDGTDSASATTQVIANSLLSIGLSQIIEDKKAFVNFDRTVLIGGLHTILPADILVIEVLETVEPDAEVIAACQKLIQQGYTIALDDFVNEPRFEPLTKLAKIIKVDVRATTRPEQTRLLNLYKPRGVAMLAEKVETHEEFEWALAAGFDYFQGYFFARPNQVRGRQVPTTKLACLKLLAMLQPADLDFAELEKLIGSDVSFAFKLLRFANSALFARTGEVHAIDRALVVIGEPGIRHWAVLATLPVLAKDKPNELIVHSLLRARFCENLAKLAGVQRYQLGFLMGLFSLLDGLIDLPLEEALSTVNLLPELKGAILGTSDPNDAFRNVFELVSKYEAGDWNGVAERAARLHISNASASEAYVAASLWVQQSLKVTSRMNDTRRAPRRPMIGAMQILWEGPDRRERVSNAKLLNISTHGMQLQVDEAIPARTYITCNDVKLGVSGRGCVRYCNFSKGKHLIGVEFSGGTGWRDPLK
jgi:c-di-GMP-related signal transduction protein